MPTMTKVETPKVAGFVDRGYNHSKRQKRLEEEEAEIARLEAQARGEEVEEQEEQEVEQESEVKTTEVVESEVEDKELSAEEKSFKKRYGDLRRHMQQKEKDWEERFKALENKQEKGSVRPPKSDEDLEEWANKYPDVASIVEAIASKKAKELFDSADARLKELDKISEESRVQKAEAKIREAHEDFDKLRDSDEFHEWAKGQPKWVQSALYDNEDDAPSVIRVIDLYKVDTGGKPKKRGNKDAAKSVDVRSRTSPDSDPNSGVFSESQIKANSDEWYEANEAKILEAMRTGKFKYDISGSAR